jgi:hypothetical protein
VNIGGCRLLKNDGLFSIDQDPVFCMVIDRFGKYNALQVATPANQVFHTVAMGNPDNVLFNNGALIQVPGDVVTGGPYDFHSTLIGLLIRIASYKCRKKGMMNIDDPVGIMIHKGIGQDLHVPCQYYRVYMILLQKFQLGLFLQDFCFPW